MATSDRDIIITPNRSQSNDPKIEFKGGGTAAGSASTITMVALAKTSHQGVVELKGADGDTIVAFAEQQTGSLFSVSDESGHTKFEVNERPDTPQSGYTRWNSTNNAMEIYTGNDWVEVVTDYFPTGSTNVS